MKIASNNHSPSGNAKQLAGCRASNDKKRTLKPELLAQLNATVDWNAFNEETLTKIRSRHHRASKPGRPLETFWPFWNEKKATLYGKGYRVMKIDSVGWIVYQNPKPPSTISIFGNVPLDKKLEMLRKQASERIKALHEAEVKNGPAQAHRDCVPEKPAPETPPAPTISPEARKKLDDLREKIAAESRRNSRTQTSASQR